MHKQGKGKRISRKNIGIKAKARKRNIIGKSSKLNNIKERRRKDMQKQTCTNKGKAKEAQGKAWE